MSTDEPAGHVQTVFAAVSGPAHNALNTLVRWHLYSVSAYHVTFTYRAVIGQQDDCFQKSTGYTDSFGLHWNVQIGRKASIRY